MFLSLLAPESFSDLKDLLHGHTPDNQRLIVARTQKCNHSSLGVGNKLKLQVQYRMGFIFVNEFAACVSVAIVSLRLALCELMLSLFVSETVWLFVGVHWRTGHQEST